MKRRLLMTSVTQCKANMGLVLNQHAGGSERRCTAATEQIPSHLSISCRSTSRHAPSPSRYCPYWFVYLMTRFNALPYTKLNAFSGVLADSGLHSRPTRRWPSLFSHCWNSELASTPVNGVFRCHPSGSAASPETSSSCISSSATPISSSASSATSSSTSTGSKLSSSTSMSSSVSYVVGTVGTASEHFSATSRRNEESQRYFQK
mmetsp:Transcript_35830/g.89902  ORF Transcript_35830/g.89902 Transcript_35830/m.89902 type:complete len:205 (-) Transcript_35830:937-1551(-)